MSKQLFAILLGLVSYPVLAQTIPEQPLMVDADRELIYSYCATEGARGAWGALARFNGVPANKFKYIPTAAMKKLFFGPNAELPTDAIYLPDELDATDRKECEAAGFEGWKQADHWAKEGKENPGYEMLMALFYNSCKESLIPKTEVQK